MRFSKRLRKLIATLFMVLGTIMYMLGFVTREDLYRFIGSIDPEMRAKLEEEDEKASFSFTVLPNTRHSELTNINSCRKHGTGRNGGF